ncbi:unnamed protein product [Heterobilharzia americana]|nr:unnamed protein product [Heterobilharzia americana]
MKLSKEELVLTSGAHRSRTGEFESSFEFKPTGRLIYSDWHCSIFSLDSASSSCILYGLLQEKSLNSSITSAASNDSWVFVKTPACILAIEKNSGTEVYGHVSGVTQIASDGQNVFYLKDELLYLLKVSKLEGIISVDRPFSTSIKIRSISCGSGFLLCLTFSGQVFSQGIGSRGQLGLGDLSDRMKLTLIEALQVLTVTQISSGNWHSVCLTDTGDVYTWGWNEHGQLGHKSLGIRNKSTFMDEGERQSCISVLALPTP